ncbi:hypothetical protein FQZ97_982920 [compost metagenome]
MVSSLSPDRRALPPRMYWIARCRSNVLLKWVSSVPCTESKCAMSETLSISSRQLLSIFSSATSHSAQSSLKHSSIRGIACSAMGALPSGSFQTNSSRFSSITGQDLIFARGGMRLA